MIHARPCFNAVRASCEMDDASVRLIDYVWPSDEIILDEEEVHSLRLRLEPEKLNLRGRIQGEMWGTFGQLMFLPAGGQFQAHGAGGASRMIVCRFTDTWLHQIIGTQFRLAGIGPDLCLDVGSMRTQMGLVHIAQELAFPGFASSIVIQGYLQAAIVELVRDVCVGTHFATRSREGKLSTRELALVTGMIEDRLSTSPTIADLAAAIDMSPSHFRRLFAATTGYTVHEYVRQNRVSIAKRMLADPRKPVKVVAYDLGFSSASAFTIAFRRATGVTPGSYRNALLFDSAQMGRQENF